MIKSERFRDNDQLKQIASIGSVASFSVRPSISQPPPPPIAIPQRSIDPHAIDISSIKGRFAWEKIPHGDTYVPVIFRDTKKYFCINMLHKVLSEYPEDVVRRSLSYQYRKPIDLYIATPNEVELLNRINVRHTHCAFSRHPFTAETELVSVADFLPFYEHLQTFLKSSSSSSIPRASSVGSLKQISPQAQNSLQNSIDFPVGMRNVNRRNSSIAIPMQQQTANEISRNSIYSVPQSNVQSSLNFHPPTTSNYNIPPIEFARQALQQELSSATSRQPIATTSTNTASSISIAPKPKNWTNSPSTSSSSHSSTSTTPSLINGSESPIFAAVSSTTHTNSRKSSIESTEQQRQPVRKQSISISATSKSIHPYNGWLQINKLYTPFISTDPSNHQLYRIPVSLLSFYDLLKYPSSDNQPQDIEQTLVTPYEIKLINELCLKQNIKPFAIDTKLISLATFYRYYSANALFIKELPLNDPKSAICKDWSSIVQMHGGIYRLRNIATLHEQTVPFIGKNLVKIFQLSPQCLSSALITTPTSSELEFIQLILFFCNIPINLRHVKLIDIETVQKEYTVDLILLYNDKFPSNVLSYQQQQSNRLSSSQELVTQSQTSATTNTFAESTPPPSPRSSPTNHIQSQPISQISVNSSLIPSSSTSSASPNRFQKMITFRGHQLIAYICSGLESVNQRECVSVRDLCNILYPNSLIADKLEAKLLRLLRTKNINRFRPQNQQALSFTRLVDIKDIDAHWNFILQEMGLSSSSSSPSSSNASDLDNNQNISLPMASTITPMDNDKTANPCTSVLIEKPIESDKHGKRSLERDMETDNTSTIVQVDKRTRLSSENQIEQPTVNKTIIVEFKDNDGRDVQIKEMDTSVVNNSSSRILSMKLPKKPVAIMGNLPKRNNAKPKKRLIQRKNKPMDNKPMVSSQQITSVPAKKKIRLVRKRPTPRLRSSEQKLAAWVKKYNIEECFVRLDFCDTIYDVRRI